MFAGVERARGVVIQEVLLEFFPCWLLWLGMVGRYESEVGIGGRFVLLGHWHSCCGRDATVVPMELAGSVSSASPIVGNVFGMIPKSTHAFLLRNSLSVLSVT